jgi:hypothetical protein
MSDYFSILLLSQPVDHRGVRRLALHACLELYRVRWLRSYLAVDGSRMLCWYQAPDAEAVRLVLRRQGSAEAAVWPAELSGAAGAGPLETACEGIAVEFEFDTRLGAETIGARTRDINAALEAQGITADRVFAARYGERFVCVVQTSDESFLNECLQGAGLRPARMWRCMEIDPEPRRIFRATAGAHAARAHSAGLEVLAANSAKTASMQ